MDQEIMAGALKAVEREKRIAPEIIELSDCRQNGLAGQVSQRHIYPPSTMPLPRLLFSASVSGSGPWPGIALANEIPALSAPHNRASTAA